MYIWKVTAIKNIPPFEYAILANLLHPGFQGVRWTHDQPMPGSFPTPPTFKGKALGRRFCLFNFQLFFFLP